MLFDPDDHIKIASGSAVSSGIPFACQADALAVARAGLDPNFQRLCPADRAVAVTRGTSGKVLARALTARALHVELHPSAGLCDLSRAVAFGTGPWRFDVTLSMTGRANILASNVELHDAAADRRPEGNVHLIFKVGARFRADLGRSRSTSAAEDSREDILESPATAGSPTSTSVIH